MPKLAFPIALLVLAAGLFVAWQLRSQSPDATSASPSLEEPRLEPGHEAEDGEVGADLDSASRESVQPGSAATRSAQSGIGEGQLDHLLGLVVLIDSERNSVDEPTGVLHLLRSRDGQQEELSVAVDQGSFALERESSAVTYAVDHFGNEALFAVPRIPIELSQPDGDEALVVELLRVPDLTLHVRSAEGGVELAGVSVFEVLGDELYFPTVRAEPKLRLLVEGEPSPVVLPGIDRRELGLERDAFLLHVEADGHAPRTLRLDFPGPSVIEVELEAAGALEITTSGSNPETGLFLGLTHATATWGFERVEIHSVGPHLFEAIPGGRVLAELFVGRAGYHHDGLSSEWVDIRPGETTHLQLDYVLPETAARVAFAGTLQVDPAWGAFDSKLELVYSAVPPDGGSRIAKAMLERVGPDDVGSGSFRFEGAVPGTNRFAVPALGWQALVEVPADGSGEENFVVPAPCQIEIVMRARDTGEAVVPQLMGASGGLQFDGQGVGANTDVEFEDGVGRVRCPMGPVTLTSFAQAYGLMEHELLVEEDGQRFEIEVDTEPLLELEFVCDGEPAELPSDARIHLQDSSGESFFRWSSQDGSRYRFGILRNQPLAVRFQDFFGYEQPAQLTIESTAGEDVTMQVNLIRTK